MKTSVLIFLLLPLFCVSQYRINADQARIKSSPPPFYDTLMIPPSMALTGLIDYNIIKTNNLTWSTDYNWETVKNSITGTEVWINPVTGNNANSGTALSPKKSIAWVLEFSSANIIHLDVSDGAFFYYPEAFNGIDINRDIKMDVVNGSFAWITTSDMPNIAWSPNGSFSNVYNGVYSGPAAIEVSVAFDLNNKDVNGVPIRLTPVASIALVDVTPSSVFADNATNTFYVNLFDGRAPDDSVFTCFEKNAVESFAEHQIYFENLRFMGGGSSGRSIWHFDNNASANQRNIVAVNCWIIGAGTSDGTAFFEDSKVRLKDCISAYHYADGFDYDNDNTDALEFNCIGWYNGYTGTNADNGSTAHGTSIAVRVNGTYDFNAGRNCHDIEYAQGLFVNVVNADSRGLLNTDYSFGVGGATSFKARGYYFDCTANDVRGWDIQTNNSQAYTFNTNIGSTTNNMNGQWIPLSGYQWIANPIPVSQTANTATTVAVVFNEVVTATNVGWSFRKNGASNPPTGVSGSGTNTLTFTLTNSMTTGDVIDFTYSSITGNTINTDGVELVSFSVNPVTNAL